MQEPLKTIRFGRVRSVLSKRYGAFSLQTWFLLTLIPMLLFTFNLGDGRALTKHEIYVAGPAKQMTLDNEWFLLRVGDQFFLEKPPLPLWLAVLSSKIVGGFSEASVRLPSALAGVGVVLLVAGLMARLFGEKIGILSGLVQATSVYMLTYSRLAEADMSLLLISMAAIVVFVHLIHLPDDCSSRQRTLWLLSFWGLIGLTNLTKGLLFGAGLTLVTCIGWLIVSRNWVKLKQMWSPTGLILAAGIALIWPAWIIIKEPAVLELWNAHLFGRAAGSLGYTKPIWYYLTTWPTQLLPWTPLLFWGAGASLKTAWRDRKSVDRFIWWWALSHVCLLSLSSGKHHHYLIYALPALSPVIAKGLLRSSEIISARGQWSLNWGRLLFWGVAPTVMIAGYIAGGYAGEFRPDVWVLSMILAAGCLSIGYFTFRGLPLSTLASLTTVVLLANLFVQGSVLPRRDPSSADKQFLLAIDRDLPSNARLIATMGSEITRHIFYLERNVEGICNPDDIGNVLRDEKTFFVIIRERDRDELHQYGRTTKISQSLHTRREKNPTDRYTLYRVDKASQVATTLERLPQ